jgi:hypothetical protein
MMSRKLLPAALLAVVLSVPNAFGQDVATSNRGGATTGDSARADDEGFDLGWIGLAGLAGLAGLLRRDQNVRAEHRGNRAVA